MAFCTECGTNVPDDVKFCTSCGKAMSAAPKPEPVAVGVSAPAAAQPQAAPVYVSQPEPAPAHIPQPQQAPVPAAPPLAGGDTAPAKGSRYEAITMGGYIGIMLLMCIPIVGQILTIIWACGGCRKINKRNLARAMLVFLVISLVLGVVFYFVGRALWGNILQESGLGDLINQAGGLGELTDALKELDELKNMLPAQ